MKQPKKFFPILILISTISGSRRKKMHKLPIIKTPQGGVFSYNSCYLFLNSADLFSRKAFMPSFWSSVPKHPPKASASRAQPENMSR